VTAVTHGRALGWLTLAAVAAILWLARPFLSALLLGTLLAFMLEPLYQRLIAHGMQRSIASLMTVLLSAALVVVGLAIFVSLFVKRAILFTSTLRDQLRADGALSVRFEALSGWLGHLGISAADVTEKLQAGAGAIASNLGGMAGTFATGTFSLLLGLLFAMLAMHLVLRNWDRIVKALVSIAPLPPKYTKELLAEFHRVGRMTIFGAVMTGLVQGVLAAVGYWICGVPEPLFFGMATALVSLIPAVGTMLIWVPAGIYLFFVSHPGRGILELVWGALMVVVLSDYVIRPKLVGGSEMPALLAFVALFGGVEAFGIPGLITGPVLMSLALAVLRIYAREGKNERKRSIERSGDEDNGGAPRG
jgi:predicted PurR-regulated permease PerM